MRARVAIVLGCMSASLVLPWTARGSDFDVILNEISYNAFSGDDKDEFIELYNRGAVAVDLQGWTFSEGLTFTFPPGISMGPHEFLVVSPDVAHTKARFGIQNVVGPYTGKLDNNGEIITLLNGQGAMIDRFHYLDGSVWPSHPDGLGPSLELLTPNEQNDLPQKWASSLVLWGTPGKVNSRFVRGVAARTIVAPGDTFQTFKGTAEPSTPMAAWTQPGFNAGSWTQAKGVFGLAGGYTFKTELTDMVGSYTTYYIRRTFDLDAATLAQIQANSLGLTLHVKYDDGFVAYLNGTEVGRANVGSSGTPVPHSAGADSGIDDGATTLNLNSVTGLLQPTGNVLAVQGVNQNLTSPDFLLSAELILSSGAVDAAEVERTVVLNEIRPSEGAEKNGFIELYNSTGAPVDLSGYFIADSRGARYQIPVSTTIAAGAFLSLGESQLGFPPSLSGATYALLQSDGATWVDGMRPSPGPAGASYGRFPDGNADQYLMTVPTSGALNQVALETSVVLNEILYHPPFAAPAGGCLRQCSDTDQWLELANRGAAEVDLSGWSLSKAVDFAIPAGTRIAPGGFLVIAADRAHFLARYPALDPLKVLGGWNGSLGRNSDAINLRDALGNRVDHVEYGNGQPFNDESPADGIDDRTIASSDWPSAPEAGQGRTLELIHPGLDNRAGSAWGAGPVGGTPLAQNSLFDATPAPVVWDLDSSPAAPRSTQPVVVSCKVSSISPIVKVEALYHLEPSGTALSVPLLDNGLSGDGAAGDGVYGGTIPAQANGAIVGFQVRAQAEDGQVTLAPRSPEVPPYTGFKGPYCLYQVDNATPPANGSVTYRVVMASADLNTLKTRPVTSNVLLPCTFVADGKAFHTLGIRIRGENSRNDPRKPYRIDFPPERKFRGMEHLNLDSIAIQNELLVSDLFRRAGLPYMQEWSANLIVNGTVDPLYVVKENIDGDFLDRFFGGSANKGDLYRAIDPAGAGPQGDLSYLGEDPASYRPLYDKKSNREENDYTDIIELCRAFDKTQTPDAQFVARVDGLIDANEWARFFAVQAAVTNVDGAIETTTGEDYFLYKVPAASTRSDAGKWLLIPWDIEETFNDSNERLFRPDVAAIKRFLTNPAFAPLYYQNLIDLRNGVFSRFETRQRFYLIAGLFGFGTIDGIDSYITRRIGFIDENIPINLTAGAIAASGPKLVQIGDLWKYWKGTTEPSGGDTSWSNRTGVDETGWLEGPTGIGYGDGDDATVLSDMINTYSTVYLRKSFEVADPAQISGLLLTVDYDDGFVAYLNGKEVARRNAPGAAGSFVARNALATAGHEASGGQSGNPAEQIDLTSSKNLLVAGQNVLAFQVLNVALNSSDLSLLPELSLGAPAVGAGCGTVLYATGGSITLGGQANAAETRSVKVDGVAAQYDAFTARWAGQPISLVPGENKVTVTAYDAAGLSLDSMELTIFRIATGLRDVGGNLTQNTTWTAAAGPYRMTQDVVVPAGIKLTIEPGTIVFGVAGASIIVRGLLEAVGTAEAPILFRAYSCQSRMGGIALDGTGILAASPEHHLQFVDIEFAANPAAFLGTVAPVNSKLLVEDSKFRELTANGIDGTSARLEVRRTLFERIHEGVHCTNSVVIILDSTFSHMHGDKDAVDFDGNGAERCRIERSLFEYGSDDGIDLGNTTVDLRDNIFRFIQDKGMSLEGNGPLGPPTVTGNLVHDCGTGIAFKNGITVTEGHHNTVVGNQEGVNLFAKAGASDGGHCVLDSMIIWDNIADVKLDQKSTVSFSYSDIGEPWVGTGNITAEPRFANEIEKDFSLTAGSPAIGTGKAGTDMGALPFNQPLFLRGDADASGLVDLTDVIATLDYLFRAQPGPDCLDRMDSNDDGGVDVSDAIYTLFYKFAGGPAPKPPFPDPGPDPTDDALQCR
jgi:hypothetical protein